MQVELLFISILPGTLNREALQSDSTSILKAKPRFYEDADLVETVGSLLKLAIIASILASIHIHRRLSKSAMNC